MKLVLNIVPLWWHHHVWMWEINPFLQFFQNEKRVWDEQLNKMNVNSKFSNQTNLQLDANHFFLFKIKIIGTILHTKKLKELIFSRHYIFSDFMSKKTNIQNHFITMNLCSHYLWRQNKWKCIHGEAFWMLKELKLFQFLRVIWIWKWDENKRLK